MLLYRLLTTLAAGPVSAYLRYRLAKGKEDKARFEERFGRASLPRPEGKLLWCHAASVGESVSALPLLKEIAQTYPDWHLLITTGTVTSANLLAKKLPKNIHHQFYPVDLWPAVKRFLKHWQPDLVLWMESELWPNMLANIRQHQIPAVLINGRISEKSYNRWKMAPFWAKELLNTFQLGFAQTQQERKRFETLGLNPCHAIGNLKYAAQAPEFESSVLATFKTQLGQRPVWLAASTHAGEDAIVLKAHLALMKTWPDLLLILAPRHPKRSDEIYTLAHAANLKTIRRSSSAPLTAQTQVYLADSLGEMGMFYRLSPLVCLCGSFTWGGHNPIEPAQAGCAIIYGPQMYNFAEINAEFLENKAAVQITSANELASALAQLLANPVEMQKLGAAAQHFVQTKKDILPQLMEKLAPFLKNQLILR